MWLRRLCGVEGKRFFDCAVAPLRMTEGGVLSLRLEWRWVVANAPFRMIEGGGECSAQNDRGWWAIAPLGMAVGGGECFDKVAVKKRERG